MFLHTTPHMSCRAWVSEPDSFKREPASLIETGPATSSFDVEHCDVKRGQVEDIGALLGMRHSEG